MATARELRKILLSLPATEERSHMRHPDFRVAGKIFGGLTADERTGTLKLKIATQAALLKARPEAFSAAAGAWGRTGWTQVQLGHVSSAELRPLAREAWELIAPRKLVQGSGEGGPARPAHSARASAARGRPSR